MHYLNIDKIDFMAMPGKEYLYIVFKLFHNKYGIDTYLAEAKLIEEFLNSKSFPVRVEPLFIPPTIYGLAAVSHVDESYGFNRYFKVSPTDNSCSAERLNCILQSIAEFNSVEFTYPASRPVDATQSIENSDNNLLHDFNYNWAQQPFITIPNFYQYQIYLKTPATRYGNFKIGGVDAASIWVHGGGDGSQVTILSNEINAWDINHVNLPSQRVISLGAVTVGQHDTASVGVMAGRRMASFPSGISGIAYQANVGYAASPIENLYYAYYQLEAGDVIQLGIQIVASSIAGCTTECYAPMEYETAWYDINRALTDKGIHVIMAAGNGGLNLDHADFNGKFNRNVRDSGAIFVGAINPNTATKAWYSNYGSRIDSSSWGYSVVTTSYGTGDLFDSPNAWYIGDYGGTSAANPIVAGAAACLSSAAKAHHAPLPPRYLRQIFTQTGTVLLDNASSLIATQPDLGRAVTYFINNPFTNYAY